MSIDSEKNADGWYWIALLACFGYFLIAFLVSR